MRPANTRQAQQHMTQLLGAKITGKRSTRIRAHLSRATHIADTLYRQFQVGPYQYRLGHIHWYLSEQLQPLSRSSQYRHWLTVREIVKALQRWERWQDALQGSWVRPCTPVVSQLPAQGHCESGVVQCPLRVWGAGGVSGQ